MNSEYQILNEILYWRNKLKIPYFAIWVDNNTQYAAYVRRLNTTETTAMLILNLKYLKKQRFEETISIILHEFGHIKYKTYLYQLTAKSTFEFHIKSELVAEKYCLKILKKYFPKLIYRYIESWKRALASPKWRKKNPYHYKAFSKIYNNEK